MNEPLLPPPARPPQWHAYDYALVAVVPRVYRGGGVTAGVVLHARTARYLGALFLPPDGFADLDTDLLARTFDAYARVSEGGVDAAPIGLLPPSERFHWLTAPRSAVVQPGPVRGGRTSDPAATLRALFREHCEG